MGERHSLHARRSHDYPKRHMGDFAMIKHEARVYQGGLRIIAYGSRNGKDRINKSLLDVTTLSQELLTFEPAWLGKAEELWREKYTAHAEGLKNGEQQEEQAVQTSRAGAAAQAPAFEINRVVSQH